MQAKHNVAPVLYQNPVRTIPRIRFAVLKRRAAVMAHVPRYRPIHGPWAVERPKERRTLEKLRHAPWAVERPMERRALEELRRGPWAVERPLVRRMCLAERSEPM